VEFFKKLEKVEKFDFLRKKDNLSIYICYNFMWMEDIFNGRKKR